MPRIPYPDMTKLPESVRNSFATKPINVARMMAGASPGVCDATSQFLMHFFKSAQLTPDIREIAILRVGYLCKSRYETFQHEDMGRQAGLTDPQIEAIKRGGKNPGVLSDVQQAVMDFAEDIIRNVRASDATLAEVRKHLSDQSVLDLILLVGAYFTVSSFLETTGVELDATATAGSLISKIAETL